jgi:hypothetical protein
MYLNSGSSDYSFILAAAAARSLVRNHKSALNHFQFIHAMLSLSSHNPDVINMHVRAAAAAAAHTLHARKENSLASSANVSLS